MEITEKQIQEWKQKYGEVYAVTVEDKIGYLRKPDRKILSAANVYANDSIKYNEFILKNCWLGGDTSLMDEDACFFALCKKLGELIEVKEAELKKI
ncbi:MAG: hypothetical protein NZ519_01245 [Bacteroidia bacterium]|nr:hypothetical protein [Bacteroidia bacterium]MDW8301813.1 hypothetical protein [Bacteroidia bacterium]